VSSTISGIKHQYRRCYNTNNTIQGESMQLAINIQNESIADKVLWMLSHFKNDGVEVLELDSTYEKEVLSGFTEGLKELKSVQAGTLKSRPVKDLLDEL
jgi:hypothetical protein